MLVIYDQSTGRIKRISISGASQPLWGPVAGDLDAQTYRSLEVPDDENIMLSQPNYLVKLDANGQPYLENQDAPVGKTVQLSCDLTQTLPDGRLQMPANGVSTTNITISFKDEAGANAQPVGTLEVSTSGGKLSHRLITLNGGQSSLMINFTAPHETVTVKIKAWIQELESYTPAKLVIEIMPVG